jgi:glycosyltransferase involved in cell wall biosynthesis
VKVAFVFPNPRRSLLDEIGHGDAPDSSLLGANHLPYSYVHDSRLARDRSSWLRWQLRELVLPWEIREADVLVTPLFRYVGFATRAARGPRLVVVNFGLNVLVRNAPPGRRRAVLATLRQPTLIACLSDVQRRELLELSGLPAERAVTVRLGIDADFFRPDDRPHDPPLVLSVGKDLARDYGTFATALDGLAANGFAAAMPRNLTGVRLPANVSAGVLDPRELREHYARATCVVISQFSDDHSVGTEHGGTTALLEAWAMGKPVIATTRATLHEYIRDGEDGLLVPARDAPAMRAAIERVLGDPGLRARLGARGRARIEREFTTRHMAERWDTVLRSAA